ncbi:hypothetical protein FB45DRAFT_1056595 [Roridomyces roridus]|uniref:Uncharacterized protein n=1 Tax=Roridomyces roridus TaxID=1738132 RepID=A0AAD7BYR9_9AGAR|nr:hypothetical protein FB45DRAFT_1056595 [Roridomyces roridus]
MIRLGLSTADLRDPVRPETEHTLPRCVEDVRQNFITTVQAMAVLATLFAGVQAQLLSGIPSDPSPDAPPPLIHALLLVSYGGLAMNVGAALSGMIFLDIAGEVPEAYRSLRTDADGSKILRTQSASSTPATGLDLLIVHGSPRSIQMAWYHCIFSTVCGTFSVLLQISFLAWINIASRAQVSGIFVVVVLAVFWAALPLPGFYVFGFISGCIEGFKLEEE